MGRRKNNPELVEELIENVWRHEDYDYIEEYNSLSISDRNQVDEAIEEYEMDISDDCGESYSIYDTALLWASRGCDEDGYGIYTAEELDEALHRGY